MYVEAAGFDNMSLQVITTQHYGSALFDVRFVVAGEGQMGKD